MMQIITLFDFPREENKVLKDTQEKKKRACIDDHRRAEQAPIDKN